MTDDLLTAREIRILLLVTFRRMLRGVQKDNAPPELIQHLELVASQMDAIAEDDMRLVRLAEMVPTMEMLRPLLFGGQQLPQLGANGPGMDALELLRPGEPPDIDVFLDALVSYATERRGQ